MNAKLVLSKDENNVIIDINEKANLPIYFGREGKDFNQEGTFVGLNKFTEMRTISHLHAKIDYDAKEKCYTLLSIGRNGTHVDEKILLKDNGPTNLIDRSSVKIGDLEMTFIYY